MACELETQDKRPSLCDRFRLKRRVSDNVEGIKRNLGATDSPQSIAELNFSGIISRASFVILNTEWRPKAFKRKYVRELLFPIQCPNTHSMVLSSLLKH